MAKVTGMVKKAKDLSTVVENLSKANVEEHILKVREIFYSLQGEGGRAGQPSIFIRLAYCNKNCWFCDTDWSFGDQMTVLDIANKALEIGPKGPDHSGSWIVWTGGEPTLQLTEEILKYFTRLGFKQAIETNGTNPVPKGIDYVVSSPKVNHEILRKNFPNGLDELRYPYEAAKMPNIKDLPKATHYYVSPLFLGEEKKRFELNMDNLHETIDFCLANPKWKLSVQQHKLWDIR